MLAGEASSLTERAAASFELPPWRTSRRASSLVTTTATRASQSHDPQLTSSTLPVTRSARPKPKRSLLNDRREREKEVGTGGLVAQVRSTEVIDILGLEILPAGIGEYHHHAHPIMFGVVSAATMQQVAMPHENVPRSHGDQLR